MNSFNFSRVNTTEGLLFQMVSVCLKEIARLFSRVQYHLMFYQKHVGVLATLHPHHNLLLKKFLTIIGLECHFLIILVFISLVTTDAELFSCYFPLVYYSPW